MSALQPLCGKLRVIWQIATTTPFTTDKKIKLPAARINTRRRNTHTWAQSWRIHWGKGAVGFSRQMLYNIRKNWWIQRPQKSECVVILRVLEPITKRWWGERLMLCILQTHTYIWSVKNIPNTLNNRWMLSSENAFAVIQQGCVRDYVCWQIRCKRGMNWHKLVVMFAA